MANIEDRKTVHVDGPGPVERGEIRVMFDRKLGKSMPLEVAEEVLCRIYEHPVLKPELAVIFTDVFMGVAVRKPIQRREAKP
jgi:hypothetical protein